MNSKEQEQLLDWLRKNLREAARVVVEYHGYPTHRVKGTGSEDAPVIVRVLEYIPGALTDQATKIGYRYVAEIQTRTGDTFSGNPAESPAMALDNVHYQEVRPQ